MARRTAAEEVEAPVLAPRVKVEAEAVEVEEVSQVKEAARIPGVTTLRKEAVGCVRVEIPAQTTVDTRDGTAVTRGQIVVTPAQTGALTVQTAVFPPRIAKISITGDGTSPAGRVTAISHAVMGISHAVLIADTRPDAFTTAEATTTAAVFGHGHFSELESASPSATATGRIVAAAMWMTSVIFIRLPATQEALDTTQDTATIRGTDLPDGSGALGPHQSARFLCKATET